MDRIELIEYRTPTTKHFLNKDKSIDIDIYDQPIHYLKNGIYEEIKTEEDKNRAVLEETSNSVIDTYIYPGDENVQTYKENIIKAGIERVNNKDVTNRTLLKFALPAIPSSYAMVSASLFLTGYIKKDYDEMASNEQLTVHKVTQDWTEKTAKWNNMNNKYDARIEETFFANRSPVTVDGNNLVLEKPTIIPVDITNMVKDWYNNEPNYGLMIKAYEEVYNSNVISGEFFSKDFDNNIIQPRLRINFKNFSGLDSYLTYSSNGHELGSSYINNYNGNLVSTFNVANTVGGPLPANLYLTYNTSDIANTIEQKEYGCGLSFKPNYIQTIEEVNDDLLKYLDETSAIHYFYKQDKVYKDEDGLFLTLEKIDNNYIMTDKDKNTSKYIKHNNIYYLEEIKDTSGNTITINYDTNNRITKIIDASNNEINITYGTNTIKFISPYKTVIATLVNNQITSIENLGNTTTISYNTNKLIDKILNSNGLYTEYEYLNDYTYKVSKVTDYGRDNEVGDFLEFTYNLKSTMVKDCKGLINTYTFNNQGNTDGITSLDKEKNLNDAYGKTYIYGEPGTSSVNKIKQDNFVLKTVNNLIDDSSFENTTNTIFSKTNDKIDLSVTLDGHYGNNSLCVKKIADGTSSIYLDKKVEKGKYYTFSAYIKNTIPYTLSLSYGAVKNEIPITKINNEYVRQLVTIFYPETATSDLKITITPNNIGELYIDDIQLETGKVANYYNLVNNSSFESGTNFYNIESYKRTGYEWNYEVEDIEPSVKVVDIGNNTKALQFINSPSIQTTLASSYNIKGKKGDVYELSFWYKNKGRQYIPTEESIMLNPEASFVQPNLHFEYIDYEDTDVDEEYGITDYNDDWHFFSKKFVAKADYNNVDFNLNVFREISDFYITNISIFKDLEGFSYTYDDEGNLVSSVDTANETSKFDYNNNNQLIKATTPLGNSYKYEYDEKVVDRLRRAISPSSITNEIEYDQYSNPIRTVITNTGVFESLEEKEYYIRARGTDSYFYIKPDKNLMIRENKCSHDKFKLILLEDNKIKIQYTVLNNYYIKDNNGALKVEYGDNNNIFELIKNINKSYSIKSTTSDLAITFNTDHSLSLTTYNKDNTNQQFLFEIAEKRLFIESSADYSDDGRFIKSVTDQVGNTYTYDTNTTNGLLNSIIDPNNSTTNYTYDSKLRITDIVKNNHKVSYKYDTNNNLSDIVFGTDNYKFNYDNFNNTSSVKINNNTLVTNTYEPHNGNLTKVTYGNNDEVNYTYDELNRLESIIKENNTYTNYYDNLNRVSKLESNDMTHLYEYDFASRLSTYKNSDNYETTYEYDKDNNVIEKTEELNNKYVYNYEYNSDNVLTKLTNNNSTFNYKYDLLGRLESQNINDKYKTDYNYITRTYKTSTLINKVNDNGTEYSYSYDKLNNITEIRKNNTLTNKYYYDEYSELIKEDDLINNLTKVYTYDNYGNILSKKTYTYNTTNLIKEDKYEYKDSNWQDLLTKFNNESITYDTIGNPLTIGNKTLTWMNGKELSTYSDGTNDISYKYNLNGIRTSKIVNGVETKYYLEGRSIIFEDRNGDVIYYIYNGDELLGFIYNSKTYYYHKNMFGDIIGILDSNYNEIVTYEYDSWGALVNVTDNSNINLGTINPFRYRSYYYDEETQLYYLNSRYYNPEWGRFINADSIVLANRDIVSGNLFQYVSNNPVNNSDLTGKGFADALPWVNWQEVKDAIATGLGALGAAIGTTFSPLAPYAIIVGGTALIVGAAYNYAQNNYYDGGTNNNNSNNCNYVYTLNDKITGKVMYVGRTTNLDLREKQHLVSGRSNLVMDKGKNICLTYEEARGLEQRLIVYYNTLNKNNPLNNQINGISKYNPRLNNYLIKSQGIFYEEYYVGGPIERIQ